MASFLCGEYEVDDDFDRIDLQAAHRMLAASYWAPGVAFEKVERAARGSSLVVGAYRGPEMVGYLRVVSDRATFGWICDVIIRPDCQRQGLGRAMVAHALAHPEHQGFRRWVLATRDAHAVYQACGFEPLAYPERWMIYFPPGSIDVLQTPDSPQ